MPWFSLLSPTGLRARLSIFVFHRVLPAFDPMRPNEPNAGRFEAIVRFIRRAYTPMTLGAAAAALRDGRLPPAAACITFDDGYADNAELAVPILERHGVPATFFIATGYLGGGIMWNDVVIEAIRVADAGSFDLADHGLGCHALADARSRCAVAAALLLAIKYLSPQARDAAAALIAERAGFGKSPALMMSRQQLLAMHRAGMEVGAHTHTHPILESVSDQQAEAEITRSKLELESILGQSIAVFAYPNGRPGRDYSARHVAMVSRAGFDAAVSTEMGIATSSSDALQLPRFTPWDRGMARFALRCGVAVARATGGRGVSAEGS